MFCRRDRRGVTKSIERIKLEAVDRLIPNHEEQMH
jgi:hypothetical protein